MILLQSINVSFIDTYSTIDRYSCLYHFITVLCLQISKNERFQPKQSKGNVFELP